MDFRLSRHAEWEMTRRGIALEQVQVVMDQPEQRLIDESGTRGCGSKMGKCICCESWWPKMKSRL
jgi:hypothetical protein